MQGQDNTHLIKSENALRQGTNGKAFRDGIERIFGDKKVVGTAKLKVKKNLTSVVSCPSANKFGGDTDGYRTGYERIFGDKTSKPQPASE